MANEKAVTYVGDNTPFVDRIYNTRMTFEPGQTRTLPLDLAAKLLRHADVFQEAESDAKKTPAAKKAEKSESADQDKKTDDTNAQLEAAAKAEAERRAKEDSIFTVKQSIETMDKAALRDFAKVNFKHEFPGNLGVAKMREQAAAMVDQYGMP